MGTVREIMAKKGGHVWSIGKDAVVLEAATFMNEHRIGALVVLEGTRVLGMFTERDVLRRVVGERRDPARTPVLEVMTSEVICCRPETTIEEARGVMMTRRIRHLPVVSDDGQLMALISIGDLNAHELTDHEQTIHMMKEYMHGRV